MPKEHALPLEREAEHVPAHRGSDRCPDGPDDGPDERTIKPHDARTDAGDYDQAIEGANAAAFGRAHHEC